MRSAMKILPVLMAGLLLLGATAQAEILAMVNYESAPEQSLKKLKMATGPAARREGIAIIDVDPKSANYGKWLADYPLPNDGVSHHIFYNKDLTKGYVTPLGKPRMYVIDLTRNPYRIKQIDVPTCQAGEDVVFDSKDRWYLSCMGTHVVVVGDVKTDKVLKTIKSPAKYTHGVVVHEGIDRMLTTSTVRATDLGDPGETIGVTELSTGKSLGTIKVSNKKSPSGEAPVEILFVPGSSPPVAYVTNMFGGTLWALKWNAAKKNFAANQVFDFGSIKAGVPLEIYFNKKVDRMYVTTAKPGGFHIFDVSGDKLKPKLLKSLKAAEGAHHVGITPDESLAVVQNSLLNLPGMSDGSLTVIDLKAEKVIGSLDTFTKRGLRPNLIVFLPEWYHPAGH